MKRIAILLSLVALVAACGTTGNYGSQTQNLQAYQADLRAAAIACGVSSQDELPVARAIGRYDWYPRLAPYFLNGQHNQPAIAAAEECFFRGTVDEWGDRF